MAGSGDRLQIRLHVYDMDLPVTIPREEEEYYRNAAKLITKTMNTYASYYKGKKTDKEILYMVLIDIALRYEKEEGRNDTAPFQELLSHLTSEIEESLK